VEHLLVVHHRRHTLQRPGVLVCVCVLGGGGGRLSLREGYVGWCVCWGGEDGDVNVGWEGEGEQGCVA
jgi:hypothetical protein